MPAKITCPHCDAMTDVGEKATCAHCGKSVGVSRDGGVLPEHGSTGWLDLSPRSLRNGFLFILVIAGCDAIGVGLGQLLPAIQAKIRARQDTPRQIQCIENLKQIGVAMQAYHQAYGCFPPSFIPGDIGKPKHSWRVLILPFLDEHDLYARYRFDEPWNGPHNTALTGQIPTIYRCPSQESPGSQTGYAMLVGLHAVTHGPTARCMSDIKDGLSNTILVAEAAGEHIHWMEPRDLDTGKMIFYINAATPTPQGTICEEISSGHHPGQANALFCDGSVRALSRESVMYKALEALTTIDGGEKIPAVR